MRGFCAIGLHSWKRWRDFEDDTTFVYLEDAKPDAKPAEIRRQLVQMRECDWCGLRQFNREHWSKTD